MTFPFNRMFRKNMEEEVEEDCQSIQVDFEDLKENVYYGQKLMAVASWTHFIKEEKTFFSEEIYRIFEVNDKDVSDKLDRFKDYIHPKHRERVVKHIEGALRGKEYDIEYEIITEGSKIKLLREKTKIIYDENKAPMKIVGSLQDITEYKALNSDQGNYEKYDPITGFKTPSYFLEELKLVEKDAKMKAEKYGLIFIDIEGFKNTSYSLGDDLGDSLLIQIVDKLKTLLGDNEHISRYSQDSIALIVKEGKESKNYETLAENIIKLFLEPFKVDSYEVNISVNIGICIFPKKDRDNLPLKNSAKIALINSKKQGKNTYDVYSSKLNIEFYKEFTLRSDLYHAMEKDQLEIYYQPIVNLKTSEIIAGEVLTRWNHPEWGVVPPDEFISIAEETGLIIDIGRWVLDQVCKNYKRWKKNKMTKIKISVNFSCVEFFQKDFIENIDRIIKSYDLTPDFLIMEVNENIFLKNQDKAMEDIKRLRAMGIEIALDNFGTGFSSLSYLNPYTVNIIKLDKSFVNKIPLDRNSNIITRASAKLARELRLKFVAKGIENLEQLKFLKRIDCIAGQGHLYSTARQVRDFEKILAKRVCKPSIVDVNLHKGSNDRRNFFRIDFLNLLETDLTILEIAGKSVNIGNTKVLVKDIGPGGLCFVSNIRFPVEKKLLFKFVTNLIDKEMVFYGRAVWTEELPKKLYKYGIEFKIDNNEREVLFQDLNQVQLKMRNNILFDEGNFIDISYERYFE